MSDEELLSKLMKELEELSSSGMEIFEKTGNELLNRKPSPERWSPIEQIDHIVITQNQYNKIIFTALIQNTKRGNYNSFKPGLFSKWFTNLMEPPVKKRLPTNEIFYPKSNITPHDLRLSFDKSMGDMKQIIDRAVSEKKLKVKVSSPVSPLIKFQIGGAIMAMLAHGRRHIWLSKDTIDSYR